MSWNDGAKRAQFYSLQKKNADQYKQAGMSDEQIEEMYQFDLNIFKNTRNYYRHNQSLTFDDKFDDETRTPLLADFFESVCTFAKPNQKDRFWWIEAIENDAVYSLIRSLDFTDKLILSLYVFEGYSQSEIARKYLHTSPQSVSYRLSSIKALLRPIMCNYGGDQK